MKIAVSTIETAQLVHGPPFVMRNTRFDAISGMGCLARLAFVRRLVLFGFALAIVLAPRTSFARHRQRDAESISLVNVAPGSIDLTNAIGPLTLDESTFSASGRDGAGRNRDVSLSGHALGVNRLLFDQTSLSLRIGVYDHFSIGIPVTVGAAPVTEAVYPSASANANAVRANGDAAFLLGIGVSPGYEINFGDSAFRFDAGILARAVFVPTNLSGIDKHGRSYAQSAVTAEVAFVPRLTVLPYARHDLGLGFYGEMNAMHPDDWSCGVVLQLRFGRGS